MKQPITKSILLFFFLLSFLRSDAQLASGMPFRFSTATHAVTPAVPTLINLASRPAAIRDEFDTLLVPAGFSFTFAGVVYDRVILSTNGWVALAPNSVAALPAYFASALPNNSLSTYAGGLPLIAPLWDNDSCAAIQYGLLANVLTIRWSVKWDKTFVGTYNSLFWVVLDGNTGNIDMYYSTAAYTPSASAGASIGIAGVCTGDFYSVTPNATLALTSIDSVAENSTVALKPVGVRYTFIPYSGNDNCSGAFPAKNLGTVNGTCTYTLSSTFNATVSGTGNCATTDDNDVWFSVIKPLGTSAITVTTAPATCQSVSGTSIEVYASCGGALLGCAGTSVANPGYGDVTIGRPSCTAETLLVRVTADGDVAGKFRICATGLGGTGATCSSANNICALPYSQTGLTTTGAGNEYDSLNSVCHTQAMRGEDYVFSYTPTTNQCIQISITSSGTNPGVFIFSGCPDSTSGIATYCMGSSEVPTGTATINAVTLAAGQTYYIVVDNNGLVGGIPFDISVAVTGTPPAYDACASAQNLGTISTTVICGLSTGTYSTACSTPTPVGQAGIPGCIPIFTPSHFVNGVTGDVWLRFTAGFSGALQINSFQSAINPMANGAMAVYTGSCGSMGAPYACDNNSGPNGMPSLSIPVINGTTYYIRFWTENPENAGNFDLCFQGNCAPPNDIPCSAVLVPLGGTASGFNTCASGITEPANAAQCIAGGTINSVWYKAIVPASGSVRVRTHPLTLTDTQIQGYTFPTGCTNSVASNVNRGCNDDGIACSGGFNDFSEQLFAGLTPGDTLFIALDGVGSLTGSFDISIIDGSSTVFPPIYLQDCASPQVLCSTNSLVVADPGFRNYGNVCDMNPQGCWGTGERNSVWYQFTVDPALTGGTATVTFDVLTPSSVDIDMIMWDITGVANPCPQIQAATLAPIRCNYAAANSATGLMNAPLAYGYDASIVFTGLPRTYLLLLNNWNSSTNAGFNLNWNATPISTVPSNAIWSGQSDTLFTTSTNWGDCGSTPSCAIDAIVNNPSNGRQPTVTAGAPAKSVRNITINSGATLRIKAGATLNVCGNFANFGTLICEVGSTIQFIGSGLQTISGLLNAPNSFANLVINKPSGSVQLLNNIDVTENFTEINGTSVFNINGKYMKVGGNFTNFNGATTFTNYAGSTVEFNGTINQNFTNSNGVITLNRVRMNKTGGKLYLAGANSTMNIDSVLTLNSGIMVTSGTLEVNVKYGALGAITGHSNISFINGRLRRKIFNPGGNLDFPLGDSLVPNLAPDNGYNLANITFTSSTVVPDLLAWFTAWPAGPVPIGPAASECVFATYNAAPIFNNGYWTFLRQSASFNGNYNVTVYNTGFTNNVGMGWTIAKAINTANPTLAASWGLLGTCVIGSTANITQRNQLNTPATTANSFNHLYATVQSLQPLPIDLLSFTAEPDGDDVICKWTTATEINNDYFEVERSNNGYEFESIGRVKGFGSGTSVEKIDYSIIDHDLCTDIRYYRLKQVDLDGQYNFSQKVAINCKRSPGIELFPNPANESLTCRFTQNENSDLTLSILDITGRVVQIEKIIGKKGINQMSLKIDGLASGAYYLRISDNDNIKLQNQFFKN